MARYASEAKGGYYPTPARQMALVCKRLAVNPGDVVNLLDPCAGEGLALKQMADDLKEKGAEVQTYGIELEAKRAEKAKQVLDHVIAAGYETVRMTNGVISAMWLNPPYSASDGKRVEINFLRDLTDRHLQAGGLLMYCIPQYILGYAAVLLASRFDNIKVYRFTDEDYPVYKQVVVFGYRREKSSSGPEARRNKEYLVYLGHLGPEGLPPLDREDEEVFVVPAASGPVKLFRSSNISAEEAREAIAKSPALAKARELIEPALAAQIKVRTPILPLKLAHMGTAIAAGAVGGNMGSHIVVGTTKKVTECYEKGENAVAQVEKFVTSVKVFSPEGIFTL